MPRFAANLSLLFTEYPLQDRFAAARRAGFDCVELLFPYALPVPQLHDLLSANELDLVLINTPAGDWANGDRGFAAVPGKVAEFRRGFEEGLRYADALRATHIHIMAGIADLTGSESIFIRNLAWAAAQAPDQSLTIEPINPIDMPGYALNDFDKAIEILDWVGAPNLHLQFDAYHAHRISGNALKYWEKYGNRAAHVQIAGAPGRHEPTCGQIDYPGFFELLEANKYGGIVSAEYHPKHRTEEGLGWLKTS